MYLKELRQLFDLEPYKPNIYSSNQFVLMDNFLVRNSYKIFNDSDKKYLSNFTPLTWNRKLDYEKIDSITISLRVLVFKKDVRNEKK